MPHCRVYTVVMQTKSAPIPAERPVYTKPYFWQLALSTLLAALCAVVFVLGVGEIGDLKRAKATVHLVDAYTYELRFDTATGEAVVRKTSRVPVRDFKEGQTLPVRYHATDPTQVEPYVDMIVLGACLAVAAVVLGFIGVFATREDCKRRKRWQDVLAEGVPVAATVISIYPDYVGLTKRARRRYSRLDCAYTPARAEAAEGSVWLFTSERFLTPEAKFEGNVTVYVVPNRPENYYVDLDSLVIDRVVEAQKQDCI